MNVESGIIYHAEVAMILKHLSSFPLISKTYGNSPGFILYQVTEYKKRWSET